MWMSSPRFHFEGEVARDYIDIVGFEGLPGHGELDAPQTRFSD
jgi:hypothetical protein